MTTTIHGVAYVPHSDLEAAEARVRELESEVSLYRAALEQAIESIERARPADDWYYINDAEALLRSALKGEQKS